MNSMLGNILTKLLLDKPLRTWDCYIHAALLSLRVRLHTVSKRSPFELVFGVIPRLDSDLDSFETTEFLTDDFRFQAKMAKLVTIRGEANAKLAERAARVTDQRRAAIG